MSKKEIKKKEKGEKEPKKHNYLLWIASIVILVPILFLAYIILDTSGKTGEPVVGNRFDNSLNPAITQEQISTIQTNIQIEGAVKTQVLLKSATLRVYVQLPDQTGRDAIDAAAEKAFQEVVNQLPIETYFTNGEDGKKMYDLEVHVYNFTPGSAEADWNIYITKSKNAAAKESIVDVLTSPKNQDIANSLLNPETVEQGEPASAEGN
ncbi:MAG: hypothetical protein K2F55_02670 [Erysipelotrichaceae bacterium]|nr:hypothetical protein [Erysipelotrichaceae bacterium]